MPDHRQRLPFAIVVASLALAFGPATAKPGHDHHGHAHGKDRGHGHDHGHDHGHAHGQAPGAKDPRAPIFGRWLVDVESTVDADPDLKKASARDPGLTKARQLFAGSSFSFGPEGAVLVSHSNTRRRGVYAARIEGSTITLTVAHASANTIETDVYEGTFDGQKLTLTHDGSTLVLERASGGPPGARRPAMDRSKAKAILGEWTVDVDATLANDPRMKQMTAEQQKLMRDSARTFLSTARFGWQADGKATIGMGDQVRSRTWTLIEQKGKRYTLEVSGGGPPETLTLEVDGDRAKMLMGPQAIILVRKK